MNGTYIVKSAFKKYFHDHGKRINAEAMLVMNAALEGIMDRAIIVSRRFKTIQAGEIKYAYRQTTGLEV